MSYAAADVAAAVANEKDDLSINTMTPLVEWNATVAKKMVEKPEETQRDIQDLIWQQINSLPDVQRMEVLNATMQGNAHKHPIFQKIMQTIHQSLHQNVAPTSTSIISTPSDNNTKMMDK
jgi:hypothetical protein